MPGLPVRERNDPRQYDDLAAQWWLPRGDFAMLNWIAAARIRHVPAATSPDALLLDVACGGGLLAPHLAGLGYRQIGIDLSPTALATAASHGVTAVRGDVLRLPFREAMFEVVVAGEILEHVGDLAGVVAEACRVLKPGGTLVIDTIANTWWGRFASITIAERMPAGPPPRLHDGALFVDRRRLVAAAASHGVALDLNGLRPCAVDYLMWLLKRRDAVRMLATRSTAGLFQAAGIKAA
ncbi:MAG TPA: methyltransferase domain-containing protein [Mycobacteriales bacterium]|jgi:2-polyprenyl-6-hydroxyphenyl methylase/3-demethylubiquinone-9 3-methyltransferase|nr:methyltransferase domain-containing protein [Mycobacteriales bacterium]